MGIQRIIFDNGITESKGATLPLVMVHNGIVMESDSVRGLIELLIPGYLELEDALDDWNLRVQYARKQCMLALEQDIDIIVFDENKGIINNNYAAAIDDEDYQINIDNNTKKIYVNSEKKFLKSLIELDQIVIYEKEGSNVFFNESGIKCIECYHNKDGECSLYKFKIDKLSDTCESAILFSFNTEYVLVV